MSDTMEFITDTSPASRGVQKGQWWLVEYDGRKVVARIHTVALAVLCDGVDDLGVFQPTKLIEQASTPST